MISKQFLNRIPSPPPLLDMEVAKDFRVVIGMRMTSFAFPSCLVADI